MDALCQRSGTENIRENEPRAAEPARGAAKDDVASAGEVWSARLLEDHATNAEQRGHHRDAKPKSTGEHDAADWPRQQRSQREDQDHWRRSSTIDPSRMRIRRCARDATAWSCVTTTTAVPSACNRSSSETI